MADWSRQRALTRVGEVIKGKWRIDGLVGIGGTAAVYSATHRNGRRAAVKILRPELATYAEVVSRFLREGYAANRVGHAGVAAVLDDDVGEDGAPFLVMELLEGEPLENYARDPARLLPLPHALTVVYQVLDVLAAAHAQGILHRDIKPANIFLTHDGQVKVLDFGIARLTQSTDASHTLAGAAIGTPSFMPPEQARGRWEEVDGRTDLWAVGAMCHAILAGGRPRRAQTAQEELLLAMTTPLPPLRSVAPSVPEVVCEVVDRVLQFERSLRYPDAHAMQAALVQACTVAHIPLTIASPPTPTAPNLQAEPSAPNLPPQAGPSGSGSNPLGPPAQPSHPTGMTGQAVSMSQMPPGPAPRPKRGFVAVGASVFVLGLAAVGFVAFQRWTAKPPRESGPSAATSVYVAPTTAPPDPVPTVAAIPTDLASPPPSASPTASVSAPVAPSATTKRPPKGPPVPSPAKTFNPLGERF